MKRQATWDALPDIDFFSSMGQLLGIQLLP